MAINDKTNVVIQNYQRGQPPALEEGYIRYLENELQRLESTLRSLAVASVEVLDEPPLNPVRGMVKYNITPWDALGDSSEGLVVYNGTAWAGV